MEDEKRVLYHGSKEYVQFPEIRTAKYNKDFYFGFYCTTLPEQAKRWATRFKKPTHQISFHTARSLVTLEFMKGYEVYDEE